MTYIKNTVVIALDGLPDSVLVLSCTFHYIHVGVHVYITGCSSLIPRLCGLGMWLLLAILLQTCVWVTVPYQVEAMP